MTIDFKALAAPFPPNAISWRVGSVSGEKGMALAYLDARDVMDRLDSVCTPAGWQCKYSHVGQITVCEIAIFFPVESPGHGPSYAWVTKADGAGQSDIEAEKGALSDAFKRAAVRWGIGRYLYHLPSPWVEIEKRGRSTVIAKHEYAKLERILQQAAGGVPQPSAPPTLPPADRDVQSGAERWVKEQTAFLGMVQLDTDIFEWDDRNAKALQKLQLQHRDLWNDLTEVRLGALERVTSR